MILFSSNVGLHGQGTSTFFSNLTIRDGLPSNIIACITQDQYDFVWVGTGSGLARFDGYNFRVFQKGDSENTIISNQLNTLLADEDVLWVGTWHGLCKLNLKTFEITRLSIPGNPAVRALYKSGDFLWVGTGTGLVKFDTKSETLEWFTDSANNLSHNTIRSIHEDRRKNLLVGTYNGLNYLPNGHSQFQQIPLRNEDAEGPKNHLILDIKPSNESDKLWVGTELGLFQVNTISLEAKPVSASFSNNVIKCVFTDSENKLWLGTDFGLNIYDPVAKDINIQFHNPKLLYSLANNVIWQIFEDSAGVIWLVTSNGLSRINHNGSFYSYQEVARLQGQQVIGNQVKTMMASSNGNYWMGTQDGVIQLDPSSGRTEVFDINANIDRQLILNNVFALSEDKNGRIWIGSAGGINIWDERQQKMVAVSATPENGLTSNYIAKFCQSPEGKMWVSAWEGGLFEVSGVDQPQNLKFDKIEGISDVSEKLVFGGEKVWLITLDQLYRVDPETQDITHIEAFTKVTNRKSIYCLYYSTSGKVWAGTLNGMIEYDPKTDEAFFHEVITGSDVLISSIIEDDHGNIWSTSNTSLHKLTPNNELIVFPLDKDLPLKSFYYGCVTKNSKGQLLFGGDNGYILIDPMQAIPNTFSPKVYISELQVNNSKVVIGNQTEDNAILQKDISLTDQLVLDYDQRSISLTFTALHYWQPSMNTYSYKLEGLEDQWNHVSGNKNFAVYSNLDPGNYTFRVRGSNNFGVVSETEAKLAIRVKPPLLLSRGFLIGYTVFGGLLIFFLTRFFMGRVRLRNELKIARLQKSHAEELERTKEHFFTNISHELRTPISLILPPIHEIQKSGTLDDQSKQLISLAEKNSQRLLKLVNQILDFNRLETESLQLKISSVDMVHYCREISKLFSDKAQRNEIDFQFHSFVKEQIVWVDSEKIETILFNLLSNAFKFTESGERIRLSLDVEAANETYKEGSLVIAVQDSGIGIPKEELSKIFERFYQSKSGRKLDASSGIGLTLVAEYLELHHGDIEVESEINKGTTFRVRLPLGKSHLPADFIEEDQFTLKATRSHYTQKSIEKTYQLDPESEKPLILLVEDNLDVIDFIKTSLKEKYNFVVAENGQQGLEKANNFTPDLIISDIMMPVMDGLEFCHQIKSTPRTSHIMIILLTAKNLETHKLEGIKQGADVYLTKPFEIPMLEAYISNLLNRKDELTSYVRNEFMGILDVPDSANNQDKIFLKKVFDLIEVNISDPKFGVEQISHELGLSATHLYRKLKSITGHSAQDMIKKYRVKKASLMLKNNEGNISETMYKVGFSSASYFSKCFKSEFGVTPKAFKDQNSPQNQV